MAKTQPSELGLEALRVVAGSLSKYFPLQSDNRILNVGEVRVSGDYDPRPFDFSELDGTMRCGYDGCGRHSMGFAAHPPNTHTNLTITCLLFLRTYSYL